MRAKSDQAGGGMAVDPGELRSGQKVPGRLGQVVSDMVRTMAVIVGALAVLFLLNWPRNPDPVREVDPVPAATSVAAVVDFPVLVPDTPRWRATSARYEPTQESGGAPVWFTGGVWDGDTLYAGVAQSTATGEAFLREQTLGGSELDELDVGGRSWARFEAPGQKTLVATAEGLTTVVSGSGTWKDLEAFAITLRRVP